MTVADLNSPETQIPTAASADSLTAGTLEQRRELARRLAALGSQAQPAAVDLVLVTGEDDEQLREWAVAALENLGPPDPSDVARLSDLLRQCCSRHDSNGPQLDWEHIGYWAATLLGRLGCEAAGGVGALLIALNTAAMPVRQRAAWALGRIGPAAKLATFSLRQAAAHQDRRLARLAQQALTFVGPQ